MKNREVWRVYVKEKEGQEGEREREDKMVVDRWMGRKGMRMREKLRVF